jgi:hypothetical protein
MTQRIEYPFPTNKVWDVYHEPADTDDPPKPIGTIEGMSQSEALERAAQYYEIPSYDLVVRPKGQPYLLRWE